MRLGRVLGSCVATAKVDSLRGSRLLLVRPLDFELAEAGEPFVAVDTVQAARGELVTVVSSREAANSLSDPFSPVDAAIVGIVDELGMRAEGDAQLSWWRPGGRA